MGFEVKQNIWTFVAVLAGVIAIGIFWTIAINNGWDWVGHVSAALFMLVFFAFILRGRLRKKK